ncbi:angiotensin II receptor associated protein [Homo sapiens]|uniref:Angiotensin II receptor associated protein n=1 Tax=Homo sapiens TaxID=9606 RepID=D6RB40_HUMAN|nr:angiotensin II receptor associated protein [Homo sapiens]KAI4078628.1 angiotensin II receptor associated protein [Homo sapiens]
MELPAVNLKVILLGHWLLTTWHKDCTPCRSWEGDVEVLIRAPQGLPHSEASALQLDFHLYHLF